MTKRFINLILIILIFIAAGISNVAQAAHHEKAEADAIEVDITEADITAYIEIQRADIRANRMAFAAAYMEFTDKEASKFWPIYREYEFELSQFYDGKLALIEDYIINVSNLDDEKATEIANKFFAQEEQRIAIMRKFFSKFSAVIPATKAAKFMQLENQTNLLVQMQIASQIPLIQ